MSIIKPIGLFAESRAEVTSQIKGPLKNKWIGMDPKDFNGYKSVLSCSLVVPTNPAWQMDHLDFNSEMLCIHLVNLL